MSERFWAITERIMSRVWIDRETGCWNWTGPTSGGGRGGGYPRMSLDGITVAVHRIMYQLENGPLASSRNQIDHVCTNRLCVNPAHLQMVRQKENCKRRDQEKDFRPLTPQDVQRMWKQEWWGLMECDRCAERRGMAPCIVCPRLRPKMSQLNAQRAKLRANAFNEQETKPPPGANPFGLGHAAFVANKELTDNPYRVRSSEAFEWERGWRAAHANYYGNEAKKDENNEHADL